MPSAQHGHRVCAPKHLQGHSIPVLAQCLFLLSCPRSTGSLAEGLSHPDGRAFTGSCAHGPCTCLCLARFAMRIRLPARCAVQWSHSLSRRAVAVYVMTRRLYSLPCRSHECFPRSGPKTLYVSGMPHTTLSATFLNHQPPCAWPSCSGSLPQATQSAAHDDARRGAGHGRPTPQWVRGRHSCMVRRNCGPVSCRPRGAMGGMAACHGCGRSRTQPSRRCVRCVAPHLRASVCMPRVQKGCWPAYLARVEAR